MKKSILALLIVSTLAYSHAAPAACLDFSTNLSRGAESNLVLQVQNFLYAKGILKAVPNGYFGPATLTAVKAYQKSVGLAQVGNTGPATRAAIKKESCATQVGSTVSQTSVSTPVNQQNTTSVVSAGLRPSISSFDLVTLFAGGTTNWGFSLYGNNFSTSSNVVVFRNTETRTLYTIGSLPMTATGTIALPKNITGTAYSCGSGCFEKMGPGVYEVTVTTPNGVSDSKTLTIQPFTISIQNTALNTISYSATNTKVASISFSSPFAIAVRDFSFALGTSTISASGLTLASIKNELTSSDFAKDMVYSPYQTGVVGIYMNSNNQIPGTIMGRFFITIEDFIGQKQTTFNTQDILVTVAGMI